MPVPSFNFSSYYLNDSLSDVGIVIKAGPDGSAQAQLPGHGIVLANVSSLWQQQITQSNTITLEVGQDPLQASAARALVQYVYQGSLPAADTAQQQALIVHMLSLALKFDVQDCITACLEALMAVQELQLDAIHVVFSLLATAEAAGCQALVSKCLDHLQQQLGDLETTLADPHLLHSLQQLPHTALLALLRDERTSAASENTALAAVQHWLAHQATPVDAEQRQQLAAAVRVPLLEPCYLATVVPRVPWLLEILGPQGLAMAAGVSRGMFDPHAEPCLSNVRAVGGFAASWLQGHRPLAQSCIATDGQIGTGPRLTIQWALPLLQVQKAFEAACAAATAAAAAARQEAELAAAAAAAARQEQEEAPAVAASGGQLGWGASNAAAAAAAAAAVAVKMGASIFRKRRREEDQRQQHQQADGAAEPDAQLAATNKQPGADPADMDQSHSRRKQQCRGPRAAAAAAELPDPGAAAADSIATEVTAAAAAGSGGQQLQPSDPFLQQQQQQLKLYSPEVQFAGYNWRLVLYFQSTDKQHDSNNPSTGHMGASAGADASGGQTPGGAGTRAAAIAVAASPGSQRAAVYAAAAAAGTSTAGGAGGSNAGNAGVGPLDSQQTPGRRGRRPAAAAGTTQVGFGYGGTGALPATPGHAAAAAPAPPSPAIPRQFVEAAAAMRLPDEASPTSPAAARTKAAAAAEAAAGVGSAAAAAGTGDGDDCACRLFWTARLAIEARPCMALQPGVSTVAFSGSLAVRAGDSSGGGGGGGQQVAGAVGAAVGGRTGDQGQHKQQQRLGKLLAGQQHGTAAAAVARAPRSSSTQVLHNAASAGGGGGRRAAAVAAAAKIAAASLTIPESDEEFEEGGDAMLGDEGLGPAAAAAAGGGGSWTGRTGITGAGVRGSSSNGKISAVGSDDLEGEGWVEYECEAAAAAGDNATRMMAAAEASGEGAAGAVVGPAAGARAAAHDQGWRVFQLPQGSWVKSRRCDTGFRDFFGISMQQGQWDEEAWSKYLQPGGMLQVQGCIWNVR